MNLVSAVLRAGAFLLALVAAEDGNANKGRDDVAVATLHTGVGRLLEDAALASTQEEKKKTQKNRSDRFLFFGGPED